MLTPVIGYAFAADPLPGTGLVGTITAFLIDLDLAFHPENLCEDEIGPVDILQKRIGAIGFEPTASRSRTERTTRLCYAPMLNLEFLRFIGNSLDFSRNFE